MSDRATATFLGSVPLLNGFEVGDLEQVAQFMRPRDVPEGTILWRQGQESQGMLVVVEGRVSVVLHLPGDRNVEIHSVGPGEMLGELPLLDGGAHTATAQVAETARVLSLSRADFAALVSRGHPAALALKRRLAEIICAQLRRQLAALSSTLVNGGDEPADAPKRIEELEPCGPPDSRYVRRLASFREFDNLALWGFLTAGRYAQCPAGSTLVVEGEPSDACFLTINGAVEKVIIRGSRRIRVGLAGPGQAFGYEPLIDGEPSPVTATTRERTLLLMLPREPFERLFTGEEAGSHVFLDVIHRDLVATQRQALRPHARLAASL
jgi:CRP-like cAMP-binding protein